MIMQVSANSFAQKVTLSQKNASLAHVFKQIRKQTGYDFVFTSATLKNSLPVNIQVDNEELSEVLKDIFANQPLAYSITDKSVIVKQKKVEPLFEKILFIKITGVVKDTAGLTLPNVSVLNKNSGKAVITDINGLFSIDAVKGDVLIFSSVGFLKQELTIGEETKLNVILKQESGQLEQVVVTALGIKKQTRSLTYNVQELKGEELTQNKDANFVNALTGKIAGVTINSSSSGIGGATRVVMRGTKSIKQNNNVLYVIDGIPIPNNNGGTTGGPFESQVSGEGISSINPEDIESISALTGPSASALYGSQGANGVIVVTTKKGKEGKLSLNFSHSTDLFSPFVLPDFQNTYGQASSDQFASWGTKLDQPSTYNPKDFFQTGSNIFNSLSISTGTEKNQTFVSLGTNNSRGIIPNNTYNRYNFYLRNTTQLTNKLSLDVSAAYAKQNDQNLISQGQYHNPLVGIYLFPPGDDIKKYQIYARYDEGRKLPLQFWPYGDLGLQVQNPYWIINKETNRNKQDRYAISASTKYNVLGWLNLIGRVRIDNTNYNQETKYPAGTIGQFASEYGYYRTSRTVLNTTYADLVANVNKSITKDLNFTGNLGASYQDVKSDGLNIGGNLNTIANLFSTANLVLGTLPTQPYSHIQTQAAFATAQFNYKRYLYLDLTGRQEWPSQLPEGFANTTTYFYPSAGVSAIVSDMLKLPSNIISFAKLRFAYAEVGNPVGEGLANPVQPIDGGTVGRLQQLPFPNILAERTKSYEAGAELRFLKDQLTLNVTFYKSNTYNQLFTGKIDNGSQFNQFLYNAGNIQNKGIEANLGYNDTYGGVKWSSNAIFSLNRNKIIALDEGFVNPITGEVFGKRPIDLGGIGDVKNYLTVGGTMSDVYVSRLLREDNQGQIWVDPNTSAIADKKLDAPLLVGHSAPDYNIGWRNSFSYKNFDLSFLLDARIGGIGVSMTQSIMDAYGVSQQSADARDGKGVLINGALYPNVRDYYTLLGSASGASTGILGYYVYSATNVRLREASLSYTFSEKLLGGKLKAITVAAIGRNLLMFYNKSPFDPESTSSTGTFSQGFDYFRQPSYRSYGFSIRASF